MRQAVVGDAAATSGGTDSYHVASASPASIIKSQWADADKSWKSTTNRRGSTLDIAAILSRECLEFIAARR